MAIALLAALLAGAVISINGEVPVICHVERVDAASVRHFCNEAGPHSYLFEGRTITLPGLEDKVYPITVAK